MEQEYFTPRQVAKLLRVDYTTVMRWIRTGLLDAETIREGRRNRHPIREATNKKLETQIPSLIDSKLTEICNLCKQCQHQVILTQKKN